MSFKHIYNLGLFSLGWHGLGWGPLQYVHPILIQRMNFLCKMLIQYAVSWCISNALIVSKMQIQNKIHFQDVDLVCTASGDTWPVVATESRRVCPRFKPLPGPFVGRLGLGLYIQCTIQCTRSRSPSHTRKVGKPMPELAKRQEPQTHQKSRQNYARAGQKPEPQTHQKSMQNYA